jgi:phosphohistidine phosphatase SixA
MQGLKVASFESRRAQEIAELIRRYGGEPIAAPSMREVPPSENHAVLEVLPAIEAGQYGLKPDIVPHHPKMGSLLAEVAAAARDILTAKRIARP